MTKKKSHDGVSLRTIHMSLIVGAVIIAALMIFSTYHLSTTFSRLTHDAEQQIELRKAARELMDASDYLTENVQRFTIHGEMRFLKEYFVEAFDNQRREEAVNKMTKGAGNGEAARTLQAAMKASLELMDREYYAMRLVIEAKGYEDYPDLLKEVELSAEDKALSPQEKMSLAVDMVHDDTYYTQKGEIRSNMMASLDELERMAYDGDAAALWALRDELNIVRVVIVIQALGIFFMVWLTSRLGIHPVLNAVEKIKEDSPIPVIGANEFRYLARTYNKMYEVYKNSLEHLNFKASHDELTGAYNRTGYDLLASSVDLPSTYLILLDIDDFKSINDTYGHEMGDRVLVKVVNTLQNNFRADDYVCRMGGDEFVIMVIHASQMQQHLLETKINQINSELGHPEDGLPATSISAGIVHGVSGKNAESLLREADSALYETKKNGKCGFTFA